MREMEDDLLDYRRTREWICEILEEVIVLAKVDIIRVIIYKYNLLIFVSAHY